MKSSAARTIWCFTGSLLLGTMLLPGCGKGPQAAEAAKKEPSPAVPISVMPVRAMELQRSVKVTGSLVGLETATLSNRVAGRITKIYVDRGDRVKTGGRLLEIEPDRFEYALSEAQASLQQTLARLGIEGVPGQDFDVNKTAPVKKARSEYDLAKDKLDRATPLNKSHSMNDFEYLDIVSAFKSAESTLENSRDEARAMLAQARQNNATVSMRKKDFDDSVITAPDGTVPGDYQAAGVKIEGYVVSERKVSPGEYVREGTPLFTIVADNLLKLQARVPERYLGDVSRGATVNFRIEAYPGETFQGKVTIIDPVVDPASRTFMVEALVDNGKYGSRLRAGSFVPGEVLTRKEADRIMVPLDAITSFVGVTKVFKLDATSTPPKVQAITVTTGQQENTKDDAGKVTQWIEIVTTGKNQSLTAKDQVVTSGLTKLVDGSAVTLDKPESK